jgi:two-component system response regulator (stage 0 sporulation protein A)
MEAPSQDSYPGCKADVKSVLLELGVPDAVVGHRYLKRAIELAIEDWNVIDNITKVLYPKVAKCFGATPSSVERGIRHAVELAWERADFDTLIKYFGNTVSSGKGKPTNSEFIARIANSLM